MKPKSHTISISEGFQTYPELYNETDIDFEIEQMRIDYKITKQQEKEITEILLDVDFVKYKVLLSQLINDEVEKKLKDLLDKYGIIIQSGSFWTPRAYNFECDSIDIAFHVDDEKLKKVYPSLTSFIEKYQTSVRKTSDGYISLEPKNLQEINLEDTLSFPAIVWAIIEKEDAHDLAKDIVTALESNSQEFQHECEDWEKIHSICKSNK